MSTSTVSPNGEKNRAITWARIKVLFSIPISMLGWFLVVLPSLCLIAVPLHFVAKAFTIQLPFEGPALSIFGFRIDCTTLWGVIVILLFNVFLLGLGRDFIKGGASLRQTSSIAA